jgi:hypothetical protein
MPMQNTHHNLDPVNQNAIFADNLASIAWWEEKNIDSTQSEVHSFITCLSDMINQILDENKMIYLTIGASFRHNIQEVRRQLQSSWTPYL